MANLNAKKTLAAVVLAAATFATPALAHAQNYSKASYNDDCRTNTEEQVVAGAIGAVLGGVFGSQVSGNGARTEGSVLGAVLGGAAGAAIADGANNCDKTRSRSTVRTRTRRGNDVGFNRGAVVRTVGYNDRGYTNTRSRGFRNDNRGFNNRGFSDRGGYDRIDRINRRIDYLRKERADLKYELKRYGHNRRIERRLYDIGCELDELKQRKRRVKKVERRRSNRNYRGY